MEKESSRLKKVAEEKINMYYTCDTDVNMTCTFCTFTIHVLCTCTCTCPTPKVYK